MNGEMPFHTKPRFAFYMYIRWYSPASASTTQPVLEQGCCSSFDYESVEIDRKHNRTKTALVDDTPLSLTFIAETLDPVPIKPIPPKGANWHFDIESAFPGSGGKLNLSFNEYLQPDTTYADFLKALASLANQLRVTLHIMERSLHSPEASSAHPISNFNMRDR